MPKVVQTAGRDALGTFAPQFAALNDDVLFGEVWSSDELTLKMRSILTVTTLVAKGMADVGLSFMYNQKDAGLYGYSMAAGVVIFLFSFLLNFFPCLCLHIDRLYSDRCRKHNCCYFFPVMISHPYLPFSVFWYSVS